MQHLLSILPCALDGDMNPAVVLLVDELVEGEIVADVVEELDIELRSTERDVGSFSNHVLRVLCTADGCVYSERAIAAVNTDRKPDIENRPLTQNLPPRRTKTFTKADENFHQGGRNLPPRRTIYFLTRNRYSFLLEKIFFLIRKILISYKKINCFTKGDEFLDRRIRNITPDQTDYITFVRTIFTHLCELKNLGRSQQTNNNSLACL